MVEETLTGNATPRARLRAVKTSYAQIIRRPAIEICQRPAIEICQRTEQADIIYDAFGVYQLDEPPVVAVKAQVAFDD